MSSLLPIYERDEAEEITYQLIDAYLDKTRLEFWDIATVDFDFDRDEIHLKFKLAIERILLSEPVQYVIGHTYFMGNKLNVSPAVLIPRQETEELAAQIIEIEKDNEDLRILDIGTGSGCLPIALEQNLRCQNVYGLDISEDALTVARENADNNKSHVDFLQHDILNAEIPYRDLDIIVSNPPYVLESDKEQMDKNVLHHEPPIALFVPDHDPLKFYKVIATKSLDALKIGGRLYFEIHEAFGKEVKLLLEGLGYQKIKVQQDLFLSKDRMIFSKRG